MSLRLRQLQLRITTPKGLYGLKILFDDGLVIIRADNSTGKSTCIQAIVYALGLERMLGPSLDVPLPHVMTKYIEDDGDEIPVYESEVLLEITNDKNEVLTIQRAAHGERDRRLISTWNGPALSNPTGTYQQRDFFALDPGSATRPDGFHHRLASFIGWEMPIVPRFDGTECPLYMECVFPLMIVEQKHGWAGIQSNLPTFFRIKDVAKRATEFLTGLESYELAIRRQRLLQEENNLKEKWKLLVTESDTKARTLGGKISGLPTAPIAEWPPAIEPYIEILRNDTRVSLHQEIQNEMSLLGRLETENIPTAEHSAQEISETLQQSKQLLLEKEFVLSTLFEEIEAEKSQLEAIDLRVKALEEDLRRNQDINKLKKLGSVAEWQISSSTCPTCHQHISDSLLPQEISEYQMSIGENIAFIQSQMSIFKKMRDNTTQVLDAKERKQTALRIEIDEIRSRIRALRQTLVSDGRLPSIADLHERITLEERIRLSQKIEDEFELCLDRFADLASEWKSLQTKKSQLPEEGLSKADKDKLLILQALFIEQVQQYGLSSFKPESMGISEDNYKPTREGFNLGFDLSASDNVRTIWAYLHGLLELSRRVKTNHQGLLILDEPRQQETAELSFAEFLNRASSAIQFKQQVIFATSETDTNLRQVLSGVPHTYHSFVGKLVKRWDK